MNRTAQTRQENLTLPQTVDVDGENLQKLRHHELRDEKKKMQSEQLRDERRASYVVLCDLK